MSLVVIPQIVEVKWQSKIMIIGHYAASIIAHFHASNMAAVLLRCMLGEPHRAPHSHSDI